MSPTLGRGWVSYLAGEKGGVRWLMVWIPSPLNRITVIHSQLTAILSERKSGGH